LETRANKKREKRGQTKTLTCRQGENGQNYLEAKEKKIPKKFSKLAKDTSGQWEDI